jgi:hypothetical protein
LDDPRITTGNREFTPMKMNTHLTTHALVARIRRRLASRGGTIKRSHGNFLIEEKNGGIKQHDIVGLELLARSAGILKDGEHVGRDIR